MKKSCLMLFVMLAGCYYSYQLPEAAVFKGEVGIFLEANAAKEKIIAGAKVLDTRSEKEFLQQHIKGSQHIQWKSFSQTGTSMGLLSQHTNTMQSKLGKLGLQNSDKIIVIGHTLQGWGEDGRIAWMLKTFGHSSVYLVNGGWSALKQTGVALSTQKQQPTGTTFRITWNKTMTITKEEVKKGLSSSQVVFLDVREKREFEGATPYGEKRGGHLQGATHLYFKDLFDGAGFLKKRASIQQLLQSKGITKDKQIVPYCTGGVRSAWFTLLLLDLGYKQAKNYAGSMWEWSAGDANTYPLVKK